MRAQREGEQMRRALLWLSAAGALTACAPAPGPENRSAVEQDQDTAATADPLPSVSVAEASDSQLMAACRSLNIVPSLAAETTLVNETRARITPAAGNHNITADHLADGRMTARIDVKSGPGIPPFGMGGTDTACVLIVGPNYDALQTIFISYKTGERLNAVETAVIHKTQPHPHADADWIQIGNPSLLTGAPEKRGGMIPWLFQGNRISAAQSGCGRYKCCVQSMPL
jgi:hypothetical protein